MLESFFNVSKDTFTDETPLRAFKLSSTNSFKYVSQCANGSDVGINSFSENTPSCSETLDKQCQTSPEFLINLNKEMKKLKAENRRLKRKLQKSKQKMKKTVTGKERREKIVQEVLSPYFSPAQIKYFLRKNPSRLTKWSETDMRNALTLRLLSKKTYKFLRAKKWIPLPGLTSLAKFYKNFKVEPGYLFAVEDVLRAKCATLTEREKVATLAFDEIHLTKDLNYDAGEDQIVGPHKSAQVVFIRGLFSNWKQPIFFNFDQPMTKEILETIISKVENIGFRVTSATSDMGPTNVAVANSLKITPDKPYFPHPCRKGEKIWWFYDIPHLLKLIRNHFIDDGFVLPSGKIISKNDMINLLSQLGKEVTIAFKLTERHIYCQQAERQKVRLAAQLFSKSTANALRTLFPNDETKKELAQFVEDVDNFFDIFNSRIPYDKTKPLKCGFRINLEIQQQMLLRFKNLINRPLSFGKKHLLPYQKGILTCISALVDLFPHLQQKYGITYLLTSRLNQDVVENSFSKIRAMGGTNNSPGALEFQRRLRLLILGGCSNYSVNTGSVEPADREEPVLSQDVISTITDNNSRKKNKPERLPSVQKIVSMFPLDKTCTDTHHIDAERILATEEGMTYLAGYLAFASGSKDLGIREINKVCPTIKQRSTWLSKMTCGGLLFPKEEFLSDVNRMEETFKKIHQTSKDGLLREKGIVKKVLNQLQELFPYYSAKLLKKFAMTRTAIRVKSLKTALKTYRHTHRSLKKKIEYLF
jgi:hypothetical protein